MNHTRAPLLDSCVSVNIGTATRSPNNAVNTGSSSTPPPKPATADNHANANAATDATTTAPNRPPLTGPPPPGR
ncbi:hypothetical protein ACNAW0_00620 [Micromonospora sp. SL1-18]|uniref:hypothetical protein n=1 Tax=Micromonospora sp. SL1-18 TaxID=3399128 RepID=UPI003A4E5C2D